MVAKVPDNGLNITDLAAADDFSLTSDSAVISFGADGEIKLTHVADTGLTLKHTATADDKPIVLTLQTGETDMAANDVIGKINFQAPDEGTGTDAILVAAGIEAVSEGDFSSSANATKLSFKTAASEAAAEKMSLSSAGLLTVSNGLTLSDGNLTVASGHGISFAATSDGTTMSSELLDDYEEGTYTVSFTTSGGSVTVNSSYDQAVYQKIGNRVFVQGYIETNAESVASGTLRVNVPFAVADLTERSDYAANACLFTIGSNNASTEKGNWITAVGGDGSVMRVWRNNGTNVSDDVGDDVDSSCILMLNFNYTTSA